MDAKFGFHMKLTLTLARTTLLGAIPVGCGNAATGLLDESFAGPTFGSSNADLRLLRYR